MNSKEVEKDLLRIEEIDATFRSGSEYTKVRRERQQIIAKYDTIMEGINFDLDDGASPIQDFLRVIIRTLKETEK